MANVKSDISLQVKNNLNRTATFSILGGTQDPSNGQANAKTIYEWDLTAETFANTTVITIEASTITNPVVINYEVQNQDGLITDLQTVVRLLNTLNLGVFNLDGNTIWIIDDVNIFGNIEVLVSLSFDINVFVQEAYNYFDPLGKTPLVDFQTKYTSVIQQAVDTIPDFVDFVESQGWSLCYPTNANEISIIRFSAGSFFYVTDIGGVLTTNEATSGTSITQNGLENTLLYTADISIWTTLQEIEFLAPLLPAEDCYIFKFIFESTIATRFLDDGLSVNGWTPVDSTYFVNAENQDLNIQLDTDGALTLYGDEFPNIVQPNGYDLFFTSINDRIELIPDGFGTDIVVFNNMSSDSRLNLRGIFGNSGIIRLDIGSLNLINAFGFSLDFTIDNDVALPVSQKVLLPIEFNNKFEQVANIYDNFNIEGEGATNINDPEIEYQNLLTQLKLSFDRISFNQSITANLPSIEQFGFVFGLLYRLRLDLNNQNTALLGVGFEMQYFNNWFFELGSQTFLSQNTADTTGGLGNIITSAGNTFVLSGQGYYGYNALLDCGFTINTPVGAVTPNILTFTEKEGEQVLIETQSGLGQSTFELTRAIKNQSQSVTTSNNVGIGVEEIIQGATGGDGNVIFTIDPTLDCLTTYIGSNPKTSTANVLTTFICGGGIFNLGINQGIFTIQGFTLTLPIYPLSGVGDAYGLFQRDFSGLNGNNTTELAIKSYRINTTQLVNTLVQPYGSNALFNIGINGIVPSIPAVSFQNCEFGTAVDDSTVNPSPLDILFPILARINVSTSFIDCTFNYNTVINTINFNINNNATLGVPTQTALCGLCAIDNTSFTTAGNDIIILNSNYNGAGDTLGNLQLRNNTILQQVKLISSATALPPACSITLDSNPFLILFYFQNYNMTSFTIVGGLPLVDDFRVNNNDLPSADLDSIIVALDNNGLNNGILDYSNQTSGASPNIGVSGVAYNDLIAKGWTVTGNVPI